MKPFFIFALLLSTFAGRSQCTKSSFILSPTIGKSPGQGISVNLEAGYLPYASKSYVSVKSGLWTETKTVRYTTADGKEGTLQKSASAAFVGLNYGYVPMAFENQPRKWVFGAAAGFLTKEGEHGRPAAQLTAAYTVRLSAADYASGLTCLKFEAGCMVSPLGVKPGLNAGVFMVL